VSNTHINTINKSNNQSNQPHNPANKSNNTRLYIYIENTSGTCFQFTPHKLKFTPLKFNLTPLLVPNVRFTPA